MSKISHYLPPYKEMREKIKHCPNSDRCLDLPSSLQLLPLLPLLILQLSAGQQAGLQSLPLSCHLALPVAPSLNSYTIVLHFSHTCYFFSVMKTIDISQKYHKQLTFTY